VSDPFELNTAAGGHTFACRAMGTTFGMLIAGGTAASAGQIAERAFAELRRIESELSRFIPSSDPARLGRLRAGQSLRIGADACACLRTADRLHKATGGCFDVTLGALADLWAQCRAAGRMPSYRELTEARRRTGMHLLELSDDGNVLTAAADGVSLDLGGIGKGYALDAMAELLIQWSAAPALLHGGQSTVLPVGPPPEGGWALGLRAPGRPGDSLQAVRLSDRAVSGSATALHGPHIINPRTGRPARRRTAAWALAPSATEADALSTAFMIMTNGHVESFCRTHPGTSAALLAKGHAGEGLRRFGGWD
jgi:thiamine biosynthesis lipoprotein